MTRAAIPSYFRSGDADLFGWLHLPEAGLRPDWGVLICKPFGYEAICAHRSLRAFAEAFAETGIATLRFDYAGTGDSTDIPDDEEQVSRWCGDIVAAAGELRRRGGVRRICLLGVRLGAALASLVARQHAVDGLIAMAPVVSGRRYLRELRAGQAGTASHRAAMEVAGFSLSAASQERLTDLDVAAAAGAPPPTLILDRIDLPAARSWADALRARGAEVDYRCLPGFAEMVSTPHAAETPRQMLAAARQWLTQLGPAPATSPGAILEGDAAVPEDAMPASLRFRSTAGVELIERAAMLDDARGLFGVVTTRAPPSGAARLETVRGVILLNTGATSHIGPNRMYVECARQWAACGDVVIRLDLAGLGDSAARPGRPDNEVYPPGAIDDISVAVEHLRGEHGAQTVVLAGLCAGAYHALRSATAGLAVDTLLMINPLTFYWREGMTLSDLQISEVVANPGVYAERIFQTSAWRRLLRGQVDLRRVAAIFWRRAALAVESGLRGVARRMNVRFANDLGHELHGLVERGVRIVFVFARGEAGAKLLKVQAGSVLASIADRCRVHVIDGADHIFSQAAPRRELLRLLNAERLR